MNIGIELTETINRTNLRDYRHSFAVVSSQDGVVTKLIEGGNPVFKLRGDSILFGYETPLKGVPFSKLSKDQAMAWFDTLNESDDSPSNDSGACEVYEVTQYQWDKLVQVSNGEQVPMDSDVDWLVKAGLVTIRPSGNPQATPLGREWSAMLRQ